MKRFLLSIFLPLFVLCAYAYDDMTVLSLNDFHGQVEPNKNMVGAAKIASFIKSYKKDHPNLVVVSAGDNYQGTAISNISHGAVVNAFFDYIGLKYSAVGNHDFDYGQRWFRNWYNDSGVRYLSANIDYNSSSILSYFRDLYNGDVSLDYIKPFGYHTFTNGKTVYFIGLSTLETPETTAKKNVSNLEFTNPVISANQWVSFIKDYKKNNLPKPDTIVLLTHIPSQQKGKDIYSSKRHDLNEQSEIYSVTKNVAGISAVLSGHSHMLVSGYLNNVAVVQGASQGKNISVLHYDCHTTANECKVTPEVINLSKATKNLPSDKGIKKILDSYTTTIKGELEKVITKAPSSLSNQAQDGYYNIPLTYTLADIIKTATVSNVALLNSHGIRRSLPSGDITYSMLYEMLPFDNTIVTLNIRGDDLLELIKHSLSPKEGEQLGVFAGINIDLDKAGNISKVLVGDQPLDLDRVYKIATIDFLITGGDGFVFKGVKNYKDSSVPARDLIIKYWSSHPAEITKGWQNINVKD
ncbi:2',3'-cyclic-nucleotide 2'-phosphodiesterase/3'-nucleotidase [Allofrancisella inopinata]|uniref:Bifunctional metallophosphatase/5'-nucleotidase n=1 Tax=Allofrancisella inopinata TaxID=1085647 RepID=A0AAE6YK04_9GAMM|nr:5'-nucleotidase C-terminal domain-containing protein [Allofrancisella inopinata]QIV96264.1 bifunctional metallophosphatase/5'-nucleotidase [Allofrancisella inopinata]TDT74537.1 2',3'-cyclic-nucleotide 2'-phosphodiesterase/3'-nucleotidase [Allofrancisella inopinata]